MNAKPLGYNGEAVDLIGGIACGLGFAALSIGTTFVLTPVAGAWITAYGAAACTGIAIGGYFDD